MFMVAVMMMKMMLLPPRINALCKFPLRIPSRGEVS
jgi:hypothetical protein